MLRIVTRFGACAIVVLISGCASMSQPCMPPSRIMASAEMIFGRNIGDRPGVSEAGFAHFVATEITPRFPDGFTVVDGHGQWRDEARGSNVRERAKVVLITFADSAEKRASLVTVADNYKKQFSQHSVLTQIHNVCVTF